MTWLEATRAVLTAYKVTSGIPYYWKRCEAAADQLPDIYIVYFMVDDPGETWADGQETSHQPRVQVSLYFRDKPKYLTIPDQIKAAFMTANFMRQSEGELPYQADTSLYGWYCDFNYYERR